MEQMEAKGTTQKNIQSVERAVRILDYLSTKSDGARLKDIIENVKLNKSTAFGLVSTLERLGCVEQDQSTSRYRLGVRVLGFAQAMQHNTSIIDMARPEITALSLKYDETVNLALMAGHNVLYVDRVQSSKSVRVEIGLGAVAPVHCCSTGKVFLAFSDEDKRNAVIRELDFTPKTIHSITSEAQLRSELDVIRERGYAYDREEFELGLTCIAGPLCNERGEVVAAISLNAPTIRMAQLNQEALIQDIRTTATSISKKLGNRGR